MTSTWKDYYDKVSKRSTHPILKIALGHSTKIGKAYDLGAGAGVDTKHLIENDWKVVAIDKEKSSAKYIKALIPSHKNLKVKTKGFEELKLTKSDLIFGSASFPFCHPLDFNKFWNDMSSSLKKGGILAGNLFGHNDTWAKSFKDRMSFQNHKQISKLFNGFDILFFDELEEDRPTAMGREKHWHIYSFVLRKL
ncbi:hypothetical protein A9Q84_18525 [Halobacteriovorax marinus]|uniref:Methyltransferase domain-containing protein n=1 Tax=Halobacteriovorax marinus TaxID=97084 RepID=A0A1Y5F8H1_9BACT|nr:hypothetical protein A9Q84_18525 [Halobacteriovorax marinus]